MQNLIEKLKLGDGTVSAALWIGLGLLLLIIVIALALWLIRALRPTLNMSGGQSRGGRPQRLAVTDAFNLDREGRKLVIIRRDNVEHLLLIGGPSDIVVEANIVRGERAIRDRAGRSDTGEFELPPAEMTRVPSPAPQSAPQPATNPVPAPQRPVASPPVPMPRAASAPSQASPPVSAAVSTTPPVFTLPTAPAAPVRPPAPQQQPPKFDDEFERALNAMQVAQRQASPPAQRPPLPPVQAAPQIQATPPVPVQRQAPTLPPAAATPTQPPLMPRPPAPPTVQRTEPVSEMARRLNEVLQKPLAASPRPAPAPQPAAASIPHMEAPRPASSPAASAPEHPVMPNSAPKASPTKPVASVESEMDMLEEEMARLLGRPMQPKKPDSA